ncbi:MAG: hypothetical protein ACJ8H8_30110 [Geminicoccaceae bacterium]
MTLRATAWLLPLGLLLGTSAQALGQATVPAQPPPAGTPDAPPEVVEPPPPTTDPAQAPAGTEQLQQSDGVIQAPTRVDPGLVKPPPDAGAAKMPVIPPPPAPPPAN